MRKWKRGDTADGPRFRSSLAPHEADLLNNLVTAMMGLLDEHESYSSADELVDITGIKTGHSESPPDPTLRRLLPDFYRPQEGAGSGTETPEGLNAALRGLHEPEIIDAKRGAAQELLDTVPGGGGGFELTEEQANAWVSAVNDVRLALGFMLDIGPGRAGTAARRPPDGHAFRCVPMADRAAGISGAGVDGQARRMTRSPTSAASGLAATSGGPRSGAGRRVGHRRHRCADTSRHRRSRGLPRRRPGHLRD